MSANLLRRAGLAVAAILLVAACGDDDATTIERTDGSSVPRSVVDSGGTETTALPDEPSADDPIEEEDGSETVIEVDVAGGEVTGGGRHEVELGSVVTIRVTSDVADHVHLHGYDVLQDVGAGETVDLTFEATIPGVFEVELEDSRLLLVELEIS